MHIASDQGNTSVRATRLDLSANVSQPTMTSREIADLVGSRHDKVKQSIERLVDRGTIVQPPMGVGPKSANGVVIQEYLVCKRDSFVVVAQLCPEFTAALVDRWQELEAQLARPFEVPTNLADALRLAADQADENERLLGVIHFQAPKVEAIKRLAAAQGALCLTDAAKVLQVNPRQFINWLINRNWLYQRGKRKRLAAIQERIDSGLMTHKVTELKPDVITGDKQAVAQPLVTPKGLTRLAEMLQEAV